MIELIDVSKTFYTKSLTVEAVKDVTLRVEDAEIFGVIGYSGAGKSTLVRCINLLERPTQGHVILDGVDLTRLKEKELRQSRQKIGMIFQQFNLLASRTVFENVAFPLSYRGHSQAYIKTKVNELLKLVKIEEKIDSYPSQLSGGQKQRVAIARALANDPKVLLCDEATSALDPQTTRSILALLKDVNEKLGITIIIITHEMSVIKEICNRVAVMDEGAVVELGEVAQIFAHPQQKITADFIRTTNNLSRIDELLAEKSEWLKLKAGEKLIRIDYFGSETKEAIISEISRRYALNASIIFGNIEVIQNHILGSLIVILSGEEDAQQNAIQFLKAQNIRLEVIKNA